MTACSTARAPYGPPAPDAPGITLALAPRPSLASPLVASGSFHLLLAEAQELGPEVHRALVLLVQHPAESFVLTPFRELLLFADDLVAVPGGVQGSFTVDLLALRGQFAAGDYHVSASLGQRLSNVVPVHVS